MPTIVISYRREDTELMVGRICDRLRDRYGADNVMMDIDSIPFGLDFRKHIRGALERCDAMLAVMGPSWAAKGEDGQPRLDDETDWVRIEIEAALAKDIPVIPVLINGAQMPKPRELPDSMEDLAFRQATEVDMRRDFHTHMDRLIRVMDQLFEVTGPEEPAAAAQKDKPDIVENAPPAPIAKTDPPEGTKRSRAREAPRQPTAPKATVMRPAVAPAHAPVVAPSASQSSLLLGIGISAGLAVLVAMVVGYLLGLGGQMPEAEYSANDTSWVVGSAAIPLLTMVPALSLLYGSLLGVRDASNMFGRALAIVAVAVAVWLAWGYSLGFTEGGALTGGLSKLLLAGITSSTLSGTIPEYAFIAFLAANACMTALMVAGAFVERMKLPALLLFTALWITFVYAPISYWIWGGGFLSEEGVLDFAGGLSSFIAAGVTGLVGIAVMGLRAQDTAGTLQQPLTTRAMAGGALLWLGWCGLIAGSYLAVPEDVPGTVLNLAAASLAGGLTWLAAAGLLTRRAAPLDMMWGALAAIAAFAPASGFLSLWGSIVLGAAAALASLTCVAALKKQNEPMFIAFCVYLVGGIAGMIGTGVLAAETVGGTAGLLEGNPGQVTTQALGAVVSLVWAAIVSIVIFYVLRPFGVQPAR